MNLKIFIIFITIMKHCKEKDCNKTPTFNYKNEKGGIYCKKHSLSLTHQLFLL